MLASWQGVSQISVKTNKGRTALSLIYKWDTVQRSPWQGACPSRATLLPTQTQARAVAGARAAIILEDEVLVLFSVVMSPLRAAGAMQALLDAAWLRCRICTSASLLVLHSVTLPLFGPAAVAVPLAAVALDSRGRDRGSRVSDGTQVRLEVAVNPLYHVEQ